MRPFWPGTGIWWMAPPAVLPGALAPPAAPPTLCAMREGRACGCGMWRSRQKLVNNALSKDFVASIMKVNRGMVQIIVVSLSPSWNKEKFTIYLGPAHKARGTLREFIGCQVELGEIKQKYLARKN